MTVTPLLETKFRIPAAPLESIPRTRLTKRLDVGLHRKLILVSAPAGFGKTTLLVKWAAACGASVAWLSLDDSDNDPAHFTYYLQAALRAAGVDLEEHAPGEGWASGSLDTFLTALLNQIIAGPGQIVLVLDDYHLITAETVHDAVGFLIDHMPARMHIAIATRADPPLPVARLRGRGQLCEIRLSDLRFTPDETMAFLGEVMGLALSDTDITALATRTEGWIAGLQMAGLSLQGRHNASRFIADFTGSNRYILDYLLEEVLDREPEHVQTFLLRTSILERLCVPLCNAVLGIAAPTVYHSRSILEHIEHANLFLVPLDDRREWYRYHRLFSDLLQQRLAQTAKDAIPELHRRASRWFEENGWVSAAIEHALAAEETERAADLIEENAEATLMRGEIATFLRWADALPDESLPKRPLLCILYAWTLLLSGHSLDTIEPRLQEAELHGTTRGHATALRGMVAAFQGKSRPAMEYCEQALDQLPPEERFARDIATWILNLLHYTTTGGGAGDQLIAET
ncbi:MAG: LuxR family transcriptional regulator, partial [Anaerolineae bacterium]|nr:LuxR family transcriptional regulator [Anaerolineae bacterium]